MIGEMLSRYWWLTLLRGLFWILLGITVFARPGISVLALTLALGIVMFADGVVNAVNAIAGRKEHEDWWVLLLVGITGIGVGILTFRSPAAVALAFVFYVAIWAIATGMLEIIAAVRLRKQIKGELWMVLAGIASVIFGVLLVARPGFGVFTLLWIIGIYSIAFGIMLLMLSVELKAIGKNFFSLPRAPHDPPYRV
jgi:uncharacterized membrane protein HdeD (DUF308 family)